MVPSQFEGPDDYSACLTEAAGVFDAEGRPPPRFGVITFARPANRSSRAWLARVTRITSEGTRTLHDSNVRPPGRRLMQVPGLVVLRVCSSDRTAVFALVGSTLFTYCSRRSGQPPRGPSDAAGDRPLLTVAVWGLRREWQTHTQLLPLIPAGSTVKRFSSRRRKACNSSVMVSRNARINRDQRARSET